MPRARVGHHRVDEVDDGVGHRDEAAAVEVVGQDPVGFDQQLTRALIGLAERHDQALQLRHVERGRGALAGHVGDEHAEPAGAERKEVVVVPADLARGHAERRHAEARHVELPARQQRHLDLPRDAQLFLEPLLLGGGQEQVLDAAGHLVERPGELAQLILGADVDAVREVALPDALGAHEELVDRARDRPRQRQPHDERHELDDEEEDADDDEARF